MSDHLSRRVFLTALATTLATPALAQGYSYGRVVNPYGRPLPGAGAYPDPRWGMEEDVDPPYDVTPRGRAAPRGRPTGATRIALPPDADPNYSSLDNYDSEIDPQTTRRLVADPTGKPAGSLTIDTRSRKLYLSMGNGSAWQYGIGVGREGFAWKGNAKIGRKAVWPGWTPPKEMIARRPDLPAHMDGGMDNPLGARALYLFQNNKDTLFRIHGTNEPDTIGHAVSSGCIRMLNADVVDLYSRVPVGSSVSVL
jgi:lipoprotein-anchoring transpeptidase ErfK/SrfK